MDLLDSYRTEIIYILYEIKLTPNVIISDNRNNMPGEPNQHQHVTINVHNKHKISIVSGGNFLYLNYNLKLLHNSSNIQLAYVRTFILHIQDR